MLVKLKFKDFYFSLAIFISSICVTLAMALYFKNIVNLWLSEQIKYEAASITKIVNNEFNNYKLNYYGLVELTNSFYRAAPTQLTEETNIADAFGRTDYVAFISSKDNQVTATLLNNKQDTEKFYAGFTKEVQTENFKRLLAYAYDTYTPVFYSSVGSFDKNYIISLIPVDKTTATFYFVNISYENLLLPALKSGVFDANAKLMLSVQNNNSDVLFATTGQIEENTAIKRKRNDVKITENLTLTSSDLKLVYTELREPSLNNSLRQIPFVITLAGTVLSIMAFSLIISITAILKYRSQVDTQ